MPEGERRLAAIMFTDIVGYTALAQSDESRALRILKRHREMVRPIFTKHGGKEVKTTGDGFIVEFASALAATNCAVDLEKALQQNNIRRKDQLRMRIGIHVGDVVHEEGDVYGDAVNIASRIERLAEGGGTCISQQAYDQVRNKVPFRFTKLEAPELRNVSVPIDVYRLELLLKKLKTGTPEPEHKRRLAVLPFANMSQDPNDEYLADGMTEELISTLSQVRDIDVISRTSVMQYKKNPKPIKDIYKELNAGTILEGSVRKDGDRLRVTVQMIDAGRDRHLWAESYNRDIRDIFEIQSGIAKQVVEALKVRTLLNFAARVERRPTQNPGAYTLYLKGRYHWNNRKLEDIKTAANYFDSAVKEDPRFALGYVGLADCSQVLVTRFGVDVLQNLKKMKRLVAKALKLDPELAEAFATKGVASFLEFDLRRADEEFRRATELKPSYASAHQWYSQLLIAKLKWDEALMHIEKAAELDPFSQIICLIHTFLFEAKKDYGTGLEMAKRAVELNPNDPSSHVELAWLYGKLKMLDDAKREALLGTTLAKASSPYADEGIGAMVAYFSDDRQEVRRLLPQLKLHLGKTFTAVRFIADLHFYLGEADLGFEWLERSRSEREFDLFYLKSDEFLDGVRKDRRYLRILQEMGLE